MSPLMNNPKPKIGYVRHKNGKVVQVIDATVSETNRNAVADILKANRKQKRRKK